MLCIARTKPWQDVRLSVRLSVKRRYYVETANYTVHGFKKKRANFAGL